MIGDGNASPYVRLLQVLRTTIAGPLTTNISKAPTKKTTCSIPDLSLERSPTGSRNARRRVVTCSGRNIGHSTPRRCFAKDAKRLTDPAGTYKIGKFSATVRTRPGRQMQFTRQWLARIRELARWYRGRFVDGGHGNRELILD